MKRPPVSPYGEINMLKVRDIFYSIQGEGPYTGYPAIFIRLAGCNLKCSFCDENHEEPYSRMGEYNIVDVIQKMAKKTNDANPIVVITGGEPFLQNFSFLVSELIDIDFDVHVETNGTILPTAIYPYNHMMIVCSPKKERIVHPLMDVHIDYYKFVVKEGDIIVKENINNDQIYIQPMDEQDDAKNMKNIEYAVRLCLQNNYKISFQTHKNLKVR